MEPKIIYEDDQVLVLDKPAGMIVNKAETTKGDRTVQEWVEKKSKIKIDEALDFYKRAGIVHRLDKETSGILVVAKTPEAFENLQKQFKERKVKKTYLALVHEKVKSEEGEIRVPVARLPWNRKRFGVLTEGKEAITKYKVIQNLEFSSRVEAGRIQNKKENLTLLELYPETGRTHQIRVHLKYLGYPIFGDFLYAGRKTSRNDRKILPRVFLHASKISFFHPQTGKLISFESPLPEGLKNFLQILENN